MMAKVVRTHWQSEASAGLPRRDRQSCEYEAYVPDPLMGRVIVLDGGVAADVADAEAAITRLNLEARALVDTEALARLLLRAESVASSRIEGLEIGPRRLLEAEAARILGQSSSDVTAAEVLGNIDAIVYAASSVRSDEELRLEQLLGIHRRLLAGSRLEDSGGEIRR
jgi:Fic family protein